MKLKNLLMVLLVPVLAFSASFASASESGLTLKRAHYLALDRYAKLNFLKFQFGFKGVPGVRYQNLLRSPVFNLTSQLPDGVSYQSFAAAKKAIGQYGKDTLESTQNLFATTLFEVNDKGEDVVWAVLVLRAEGPKLTPLSAYSVEKVAGSNSQDLVRIKIDQAEPLM